VKKLSRMLATGLLAADMGCSQATPPPAPPSPQPPRTQSVRYQVIVMPLVPGLSGMEYGLDRWVRLDTQTGEMLFCTANAYASAFRNACHQIDTSGPKQ
jgi:hypothetical protein